MNDGEYVSGQILGPLNTHYLIQINEISYNFVFEYDSHTIV